jgi:branched-chain amino acid transport system permease protein
MSVLSNLFPWMLACAGAFGLGFLTDSFLDPYVQSIVIYAGINIILAVSLNLINGFTGQFSIGHAGFMSVGGYAAAFLTMTWVAHNPSLLQNGFSANGVFLVGLIAGGTLAALVGYLVGLPSLRLKGDYLAIVTLGFGEIIRVVVLNIDAIGGARGMNNIPKLTSVYWVFGFVVLTLFVVWRTVHSAHGRRMLAVREDEIAAESMGVHTTKAKVLAFVIGAFFAGTAGGLFAHQLMYLNPQSFDFTYSFQIVAMVVLGGMGSITGSCVAAILLTVLPEALRPLQAYTGLDFRMIIYSLALIILMLTRPNGLFGNREIGRRAKS